MVNKQMQRISSKGMQVLEDLVGIGNSFGTGQEIETWLYSKMVHAQKRINPREEDSRDSLGLWYTDDHLIPVRKPDLVLIMEKNAFAVLWILPFRRTTVWK